MQMPVNQLTNVNANWTSYGTLKSWDPFCYVPYICMIHLQMCSWTHWLSVSHSSCSLLSCRLSHFSKSQFCRLWKSVALTRSWHRLVYTGAVQCPVYSLAGASNQLICAPTGFNQSGQPIQNQESETQVCVKQARKLGWSDYLSHLKAC